MVRLVCVSILCVSLCGCASSNLSGNLSGQPGRNPAALIPAAGDQISGVQDLRASEYEILRKTVVSLHQSSMFGDHDPRVFDATTAASVGDQIERTYCTKGTSAHDCAVKINQVVFSALSRHYFAADPVAIEKTCVSEPLICDDLNALETLYRRLHNESVEESEREKLGSLQEWRQGKLSDDQLKSALHIDFQFKNGKLVTLLPSA